MPGTQQTAPKTIPSHLPAPVTRTRWFAKRFFGDWQLVIAAVGSTATEASSAMLMRVVTRVTRIYLAGVCVCPLPPAAFERLLTNLPQSSRLATLPRSHLSLSVTAIHSQSCAASNITSIVSAVGGPGVHARFTSAPRSADPPTIQDATGGSWCRKGLGPLCLHDEERRTNGARTIAQDTQLLS